MEKKPNKMFPKKEPKADMYLPLWLFIFGIVLLCIGILAAIYVLLSYAFIFAPVSLILLFLGAAALLCWSNQTIHIVSDDVFVYTTFLGNRKECRFSDISNLRINNDSFTLFVGEQKVHIESCAIMSDRLKVKLAPYLLQEKKITEEEDK